MTHKQIERRVNTISLLLKFFIISSNIPSHDSVIHIPQYALLKKDLFHYKALDIRTWNHVLDYFIKVGRKKMVLKSRTYKS